MQFKSKSQCLWLTLMMLVTLNPAMLPAATKEVQLNSGERLLGEVLPESNEQTLHLRSKILGELKLPRNSIASIKELPAPKPPAAKAQPAPVVAAKPKPPAAKPQPAPAVAAKPSPATKTAQDSKLKSFIKGVKEFKTPDSWSGNVRLGFNLSTGDKLWSERYMRGQLSIQPKGSKNFYRFGGSYSYRKNEYADGSTRVTNDKYDLSMLYRRSFSKGWFLQNSVGYRVDNIKGIDYEIKESIGLGYKFKLLKDKVEINLGSGFGLEEFQASKSEDLRNGKKGILNVFQELTWKINKRTTISQKLNYFRNTKDSDIYDYNFSTAVRTRLTDVLGLEFSYRKDFDSEVDGKQKNDTQWRSALVVYF